MRLTDLGDFGFKVSNPGGRWLADKQEDSLNGRDSTLIGHEARVTAFFEEPMFLPAEFVHHIPGARGEAREPGDPQFDRLHPKIKKHGFNFDPRNAAFIGVNQRGDAYVIEGNTRAAVAVHEGIPLIPTEVRYFNGGEAVDGPYSPASIIALAKSAI
jgi:hypothetical protein